MLHAVAGIFLKDIQLEAVMNLKGRHFLTLKDFTAEEIMYLVDLAAELKRKKKEGIPVDVLRGKNIALIFEKTSTRTRCSFEVAAHDLGMGTTYLNPQASQIGKKESIADTARVLGSMFDGHRIQRLRPGDSGGAGKIFRRFPSGTVLPMNTTLRRCWQTSSPSVKCSESTKA